MIDNNSDESAGGPIAAQLRAENARLAIDLSDQHLPLELQMRATALTLATRHCGDVTVKEGSLYQQLKMDNKLGDVLTPGHVVHCALIFERYLWGEWSKGIVGESADVAFKEMEEKFEREFGGDAPIREHAGKP